MSDAVVAGDAAAVSEADVVWDSVAVKETVEVGDIDAIGVASVILVGGSLVGDTVDAVDVRVVVGERDDGDEVVIGGDDGGGIIGEESAV